jgi:hypothetical protein
LLQQPIATLLPIPNDFISGFHAQNAIFSLK